MKQNEFGGSGLQRALMMFIGFVFLVGCSPSHVKTGPRITSYSNLYKIGLAIRDYKNEHAELPARLSDIVPQNVSLSEIGMFYVTNQFTVDQMMPSDWEFNPRQIDVYSSYNYVGTNNINGIIAFEKTNLWKATVANAGEVAVLFSDFHVQYVSIVEVQELIGRTNSQNQP